MREKVSDSPKRWQAEHSSHVSPHSGRGAEVHSEDKPAARSVLLWTSAQHSQASTLAGQTKTSFYC